MKDLSNVRHHVFLCHGSSCRKAGAEEVADIIKDAIKEAGLKHSVHITKTHCNDRCKNCPIVIVQPDGVWYNDVTKKVARRIVHEHLLADRIVSDHVLYSYGHRLCDDYKLEHSRIEGEADEFVGEDTKG
jgi:(2Fe-2S) ferredoxin